MLRFRVKGKIAPIENAINLKDMASNKIGLVSLPTELKLKVSQFLTPLDKKELKSGIDRINDSLTSSGSKIFKESAIRRIKQNERREAIKIPHSIAYDATESASYVAARMGSTYGAIFNVLSQIKNRIPEYNPCSITDFGCGPGTASWASKAIWQTIDQLKSIDISPSMLSIVKDFALAQSISSVELKTHLTIKSREEQKSDLVVASFVLSELPDEKTRKITVESLWNNTSDILVLIDRGTPIGFDLITNARQQIIDLTSAKLEDVYVVAPCPHEKTCPMVGSRHGHWCHFTQRSHLDALSQTLKGRKDNHEDLNYSYVVFRKGIRPKSAESLESQSHYWPRMVLPPLKKKGHIIMDYCNGDGLLERKVIPKSAAVPMYTDARKSFLGDLWPYKIRNKDFE